MSCSSVDIFLVAIPCGTSPAAVPTNCLARRLDRRPTTASAASIAGTWSGRGPACSASALRISTSGCARWACGRTSGSFDEPRAARGDGAPQASGVERGRRGPQRGSRVGVPVGPPRLNLMPEYQTHDHDVLVIGAGGAGLRAAIEASAAGVSVGLVCKSLLGKAHTVMAEGGIAAALANVDDRDNWRVHFADTMRGGQYVNNWRMAELHAKEAPDRV